MEVAWMESIAKHLERIADAHERAAKALEQIAGASTAVAAHHVMDRLGESARHEFAEPAREYLCRWHQGLKEKKSTDEQR
jgi:hypothetical protein